MGGEVDGDVDSDGGAHEQDTQSDGRTLAPENDGRDYEDNLWYHDGSQKMGPLHVFDAGVWEDESDELHYAHTGECQKERQSCAG